METKIVFKCGNETETTVTTIRSPRRTSNVELPLRSMQKARRKTIIGDINLKLDFKIENADGAFFQPTGGMLQCGYI